MSNRKARRAKGTTTQPTEHLDESVVNMMLKHPDYAASPTGKTLFQLADERQAELDSTKPPSQRRHRPQATAPTPPDSSSPLLDALLYATSMTALHFTLDVIVYTQYRTAPMWSEILIRGAAAFPIFLLLVYLTHVPLAYSFPTTRDVAFFAGGVAAGCYLVYSGNRHGYFHVMKAAPPVGALWVWSVVEMSAGWAAGSVVGVGGYTWWNGFEFF